MRTLSPLPVAVLGAGPVGLAAAAHLAERGIPFVVLEAGEGPGWSVREWGHVRVFSPWEVNVDAAARRLLEAAGWVAPPGADLPTGTELVERYLAPLAALPRIAPHVRYRSRVLAVARDGVDRVRTRGRDERPFVLRLAGGGPDGEASTEILARAVIDASGSWATPNVLGATGLPAYGEAAAAAAGLVTGALPDVLGADRELFAGRHTVVVGAGHSAATTLLALVELAEQVPGTAVTWAVRAGAPDRAYGGQEADALPARGQLGTNLRKLAESGSIRLVSGFRVHAVRPGPGGGVTLLARDLDGAEQTLAADRVVAATGFRPDHGLAAELRLDLDPVLGCTRLLAPLIDPNEHSCGTVPPHGVDELSHPETGYWAVGMKSYGRAPTFLMATGYEQVRSVVAALDEDWDAARRVELVLPETGVCSVGTGAAGLLPVAAPAAGCCGG